jgi:TonB-linked SusC/RagA family outer membrane protein
MAAAGLLLTLSGSTARAQGTVITGKVSAESGLPIEGAQVLILEIGASVGTNSKGIYTITVPSARANGQQVTIKVRAISYTPDTRLIRLTPGSHDENFALKADVNRLSEVVVTGVVGEATERAKVPFAIGRLTTDDIPVPALNPMAALEGKVAGVRIAGTNGQPGTAPAILIRGPTSIDASGRSQEPLIVVDGVLQRVGSNGAAGSSLNDLGGLDIESVELIKGAAGASLYGSAAANGVINIRTKRGGTQEGISFTVRNESGVQDPSSLTYGAPVNHPLQLDETGKRFCVVGTANTAPCTKTVELMKELQRINGVSAPDSSRTQQALQAAAPSLASGELQNVFQSQIWPGQYYNTFADVSTRLLTTLSSVDANGHVGSVRFYVSGQYSDNQGAFKGISGQVERRGRLNLDYDVRPDLMVSISTLYNKSWIDNHGGNFGALLRGFMPGEDPLAKDTLGRYFVKVGGTGFRPTGNNDVSFMYYPTNAVDDGTRNRFLGNVQTTYTPLDWATFSGTWGYDIRQTIDQNGLRKGYREETPTSPDNSGYFRINNGLTESMNGNVTASFRHAMTSELNGKLTFQGLYDQLKSYNDGGGGDVFIVKDIYTLSNTSTNKTATSNLQMDKNLGVSSAANLDYKDRYILEGAYRYDGSSRFGAGNRWAPFGRLSAVWRVSQEPFWNVPGVSDFRLLASRGTAGNPPRFSAQYETYNCSTTGCSLGQAGNKLLKPETTTETEVGSDLTLFNRLGVELTHVSGTTKNQILNVPTPATLGFSTQWQNAGTLSNTTWELGLNLPVVTRKDFNWTAHGTWDRTRTYITELFMPDYFTSGGLGNGNGSFFLITAQDTLHDGFAVNRLGNLWGRKFLKSCSDLPNRSVTVGGVTTAYNIQAQCGNGAVGDTHAYQINDEGYVVWVGAGNNWRDGITKNLWQSKLSAANSPYNYQLYYGHPIIDRPLRGENGEGVGVNHILGNTLPDFRLTFGNNMTYKRLTFYALLDGTFGHSINNQGEGWGLLDISSAHFDQAGKSVETAKPVGYGWRAAGAESGNAGTGGFYDILNANTYNVEKGSYAKLREVSATYRVGNVRGIGGDWTVGLVGRNLLTFTKYSGYDPEVGTTGGQANSGLINQNDAFNFPTLKTYTISISTRY